MSHTVQDFSKRTTAQTYHFRHTGKPPAHTLARVKTELRQRGAVAYDLLLPEAHHLSFIIHEDEHIMGSVFGRYVRETPGRAALIATDQRVLFLDKKPFYLHCDELTYMIIGGVTYTRTAMVGYVTLHTRLGDFKLRTFNQKNAANFVDYIEARCLQSNASQGLSYDHLA